MFAIEVGTLIDGLNAKPLSNAVILVDGERIVAAGPAHAVPIPPEIERVDARAFTVIPGMVDAHVHIHTPGGPPENYGLAAARELEGTLALRAHQYARCSLRAGFTTLRSLGSPAYVDVALRKAIDEGVVEGPRLRVAGQGLSRTGGHMDRPDWAPGVTVTGRTGVCDGPWECRKAARTQIKWGADLIKINACGSNHYDLSRPWIQEMTYDEMAAICEEAHWQHKRVAAHTSGGPGLTDAINAGLDSVEHGHWLTDEQAELMAQRGTFYVPTFLVVALGIQAAAPGAPVRSWLQLAMDEKPRSLERARRAGVRIAVGTDAGFRVDHGQNAGELEELVNAGFSPMEALVAATKTGAECLGMEREIGTIETGKYADLVVVNGNPLADIRVLQDQTRIVQVYKGGQPIK